MYLLSACVNLNTGVTAVLQQWCFFFFVPVRYVHQNPLCAITYWCKYVNMYTKTLFVTKSTCTPISSLH